MLKKIGLSLTCIFLFQKTVFAGTTPPFTTHTLTPPSPNGKNGWYVTPVQIKLTATDLESGVKEINYRVDNGIWRKELFSSSLNQAPNPSFEIAGATSSGLDKWEATVIENAVYSQDSTVYLEGFETSSAKIVSSGGAWHGINHKNNFVVATPMENMTAGIWIKSSPLTVQARFSIYAVNLSGIATEIAQSSLLTGKEDWTYVSLDFTVSTPDAIGVYMDVGIIGNGTLWVDAVNITSSAVDTSIEFTVGSDNDNHTVDFYSVDYAGNIETTHTINFKIDQTPPGNWHDSGAFRGLFGPSDHHLYVYTNVDDATSGLSTFTDKYQYMISSSDGYGRNSDLMKCSSTWQPDDWAILISPPFFPGVKSAFLITPKTDFCNSNWKICKTIRFFSEDLAGNTNTKDMCINGPWIKFRGNAAVRSNTSISMLAEGEEDNTDGLIEANGNTIDFFTSSKEWKVTGSDIPRTYNYDEMDDMVLSKILITDGALRSTSGVYKINGDIELKNSNIPNDYSSNTFDQVVFVNGNLRISRDIAVKDTSSALFVVKGNVEIDKNVSNVKVAIITDSDFYTAYNIEEGQASGTLYLEGLFSANEFHFQRTLQGTGNETDPSEDITFEPKYLVKLRDYFGGSTVKWLGTE